MENMQYADELVREFLVFRGFTNTLQTFEKELGTDIGKGFQLDKILGLIFSVYIPQFQAENLIGLLSFFKKCFSFSEATLIATLSKLETSILRYYIIHAIRLGKKEKVLELFGLYGNDLMQRDQDWTSWFAILYIKNPSLDPRFRLYFSKEWSDALHLSARNFLSGMFNGTRIPALLKISSERNTVNRLEKDVKLLNQKLSQLQALLELRDAQLSQSKSSEHGSAHSLSEPLEKNTFLSSFHGTCVPGAQYIEETESQDVDVATSAESYSTSKHDSKEGDSERNKAFQMFQDGLPIETSIEMDREEEFPDVKVDFQETFLGHTSPISRCRFSASGDNIASASTDGTVRIWTYDSSIPTTRNATIYCGAEITSLEWDCKSDRLLLIGTGDGGIKAWNVDAKRVVCDLSTTEAFPSVLDLKCSPVEPIFVSAAASRVDGTSGIDNLGFASLTVWNMRTWKAMS